MKIFLKTLNKLKKPEPSEQECKYDKGWNDAIKKVEELICSYSPADMWIPTDVKLPPEPDVRESPEDKIKYNVTIKDAELPTTLRENVKATKGFYAYDTETQRICYRRKKKKCFPKTTRMMIYNQADGRCVLCGRKIKYEDMTIDHIRPTSLGGSDSVENLQCTCRTCNTFKDKMLPDTFFDRINEIYLYQMQRKYGKKLKWKLANKLIKSMAR